MKLQRWAAPLRVSDGYAPQPIAATSYAVLLFASSGYGMGAFQVRQSEPTSGATVNEAIRTLILFGGEPIGERFLFWNFVSSSKARLEQAKEDWRQQRMKLPVGDDGEYMPLPE